MMEAVREWLTSVVVVTMVLSVAQAMIPDGQIRKTGSFLGGLILMVVLLQPMFGIDAEELLSSGSYEDQMLSCQKELERNTRAEWEGIIERKVATYISDKAHALGLETSAEVLIDADNDGLPILSVELAGEPSEALATYLEEELGIPRERQVWNHERNN